MDPASQNPASLPPPHDMWTTDADDDVDDDVTAGGQSKQPTDSEGRSRSSKYDNYFYSISYFTANFLRSFKDKTNTLFSGFLILQLNRYVQFHI